MISASGTSIDIAVTAEMHSLHGFCDSLLLKLAICPLQWGHSKM